VYTLRYTLFHIYFRFQAAIFNLSLTLTSSCADIRPLCCLMQRICEFRWNFTYFPSAMSGLSVSGFATAILISGWTRIELCAGWCCYQQRWLRLLWHPQKETQQRVICFQMWFTPFDSIVTKFITYSPKNHPPNFHLLWRNSITGCTISKISTSFHHVLMAIGNRRSAMENSDEQLRYSRKTRGGVQLLHPPLFEG